MSLWSGSLVLFAMLRYLLHLCLNSLLLPPLSLKTMTSSLLFPSLRPPLLSSLFSPDDCPDGLVSIWFSSSCSSTVPSREPCTLSSLTLAPHPWVPAWEMFCGGFPSAMTTQRLFLLLRLHFSHCFHLLTFTALNSRWEPPTPCGPGWVLCYSIIDIYNTRLCWFPQKIQYPWCWGF